jgi:hypothetical protein
MSLYEQMQNHSDESWKLTGAVSLRHGFFGGVVLYCEETRRVYRPVHGGYTPADLITHKRFRRARMHELDELLRALDRRRQA